MPQTSQNDWEDVVPQPPRQAAASRTITVNPNAASSDDWEDVASGNARTSTGAVTPTDVVSQKIAAARPGGAGAAASPTVAPQYTAPLRALRGLTTSLGGPASLDKVDLEPWQQGIANTAKTSMLDPTGGALSSIARMISSSGEASQQGINRMQRPGMANKAAGALEYAEGGVPVLGPGLVHAGRTMESGDVAGGLGETAGLAAGVVAPTYGEQLASGLSNTTRGLTDIISQPSAKKAGGLFERGTVPNGMAAEDQAALRESWDRAAPHIADAARDLRLERGEGGAMRASNVVHDAGDALWQKTIDPVVDTYKDVTRPGDNVANAIRDNFTEREQVTKPAQIRAANNIAKMYEGRDISVGEMQDKVRELNADKAVSKYHSMSPNEQVQAETADPSLRAKLTELNTLRGQMFDAIGDTGGPELGKGFQEARRDWGAIRTVEDQIRQARVPTPTPLVQRLGNTLRGTLSPGRADLYLRGGETMFNANNPNRLLPKSVEMLGRTDLQPRTLDVTGGLQRLLPPRPGGEYPFALGGTQPELQPQPPAPPTGETAQQLRLFNTEPSQIRGGLNTSPTFRAPMRAGDTELNRPLANVTTRELPTGAPQTGTIKTPAESRMEDFLTSRLPASMRERLGLPVAAESEVTGLQAQKGVISRLASGLNPAEAPETAVSRPKAGTMQAEAAGTPQSAYSGSERRTSLRDIQGVDPMRTARMNEIRQTLREPNLDARDRAILETQLADMKNNPFDERIKGDIKSMKKEAPRMSREEAEAQTEKRKAGRNARFKGKS